MCAASVVDGKFVDIECLLVAEADFTYYEFGMCSKSMSGFFIYSKTS